jgi:hypothetical protein
MRLNKGLLNASQINGNRLNNILGITLGNESKMMSIIISFEERVSLDSVTISAKNCLITTLEKLNNIN